ncbi:MAG TPA: hypothetical protein VGR00_15305, partial [Thermoanaerobaculia bacterium]|nr:hypothetical protein [Thermoanaerobaculia bacterium]
MTLAVDAKARERHPLLTDAGMKLLERLREHPDAPRFNHATGDRLRAEDLPFLDAYREALARLRGKREPGPPPPLLLSRLASWRETVPFYRESLPTDLDFEGGWERVPTTSRADLALAAWKFVPDGEPLDRLVIYRTAGTT